METCWKESHNWNTAIEGYKLFRRERLGRALHFLLRNGWIVKGCLWETATSRLSLWVKVKDHTNKGHLMGGVYYRCLTRGSPLAGQLQEASCSQTLILMGDFNHPEICWESNTELAVSNSGDSWSASRVNFRSKY